MRPVCDVHSRFLRVNLFPTLKDYFCRSWNGEEWRSLSIPLPLYLCGMSLGEFTRVIPFLWVGISVLAEDFQRNRKPAWFTREYSLSTTTWTGRTTQMPWTQADRADCSEAQVYQWVLQTTCFINRLRMGNCFLLWCLGMYQWARVNTLIKNKQVHVWRPQEEEERMRCKPRASSGCTSSPEVRHRALF